MEIRWAEATDADAVFAMLERFAMSYEPDGNAFAPLFAAMIDSRDVALLGFERTAEYYHLVLAQV